jgi:hypothetical protein
MTHPVQLPVCIIGAGSSGMATAKALKECGISFDCFELGSDIGGMWRYENDNGMSSAYRSLHIDTSRKSLAYSDFPIPEDRPDFLSHRQFLEYLEAYADRSDLRRHVRFNTRVVQIEPGPGTWLVRLDNGEALRYRAVVVANGHLWDPRYPDFSGTFAGEIMHSHHYRTPDPLRDKNVLVVGIGNSAVDIAVDVCKQARSTTISTRRSAWIMPKYIMGVPSDRWSGFLSRKLMLPTPLTRSVMRRLMYLAVGNQERYGVPRPRHAIWKEHATLSQELLPYIGHGWIRIKPNVRELADDRVSFDDGSEAPIDAIIYATGYKTSFPFIDRRLFHIEDGKVGLYRRMVPPGLPGLYMVGLVQPIGPTIPLVEIQARWLAGVLSGAIVLPVKADMDQEVKQHQQHIDRRYVGSARYTLEVDYRQYAAQLRRDRVASGRRVA